MYIYLHAFPTYRFVCVIMHVSSGWPNRSLGHTSEWIDLHIFRLEVLEVGLEITRELGVQPPCNRATNVIENHSQGKGLD